jgi:plastocyanin
MSLRILTSLLLLTSTAAVAQAASVTPANSSGQIELTLDEHQFDPAEIHVPAGKPVQILMKNEDGTPEEFDSHDLKTEKVVAGHATGVIRLRPLAKGEYHFMGEYHSDTAQGVIVAE